MDFIIGLPKSKGYGSIIVVVERFSKYATFIATPKDCTAEETARGYTGKSPAAYKFAKGWHDQADIARSYL